MAKTYYNVDQKTWPTVKHFVFDSKTGKSHWVYNNGRVEPSVLNQSHIDLAVQEKLFTKVDKPMAMKAQKLPRYFVNTAGWGDPGIDHVRIEAENSWVCVYKDGRETTVNSPGAVAFAEDRVVNGQWAEVKAKSSESLLRSHRYADRYEQGRKKGQEEGYKTGYEVGLEEGYDKGAASVDEKEIRRRAQKEVLQAMVNDLNKLLERLNEDIDNDSRERNDR